MKYEFIYKVKPYRGAGTYRTKYRCVVDEDRYAIQKDAFEKHAANHKEDDPIILINKLDDNGEFIEIIQ